MTALGTPAHFIPPKSTEKMVKQAETVGLKSYPGDDPDSLSLKHTVLFGIKGVSAYADHAQIVGQTAKAFTPMSMKDWLPSGKVIFRWDNGSIWH